MYLMYNDAKDTCIPCIIQGGAARRGVARGTRKSAVELKRSEQQWVSARSE